MLNDIGFPPVPGKRNPLVESAFEYGSRVGVWRVLRIFAKFDIPLSILGVATALEHNPSHAFVEGGHEIVSHGYRWIDYHHIDEEMEREHIRRAVETIERLAGTRPVGWMTGGPGQTRGACSSKQVVFSMIGMRLTTNSLTGSRYDQPHLIIPYSYETNDNRCDQSHGFANADDFYQYMRDAFDLLYEGAEHPKLMSIGLHDRLIGRPARATGLIKFLDYVRSVERVWFCRGIDIARHWQKVHPYQGLRTASCPASMARLNLPRQFGRESVRPTFLGQRLEHELVIERVKWHFQPGAVWRHTRLMTHVIANTGTAHANTASESRYGSPSTNT